MMRYASLLAALVCSACAANGNPSGNAGDFSSGGSSGNGSSSGASSGSSGSADLGEDVYQPPSGQTPSDDVDSGSATPDEDATNSTPGDDSSTDDAGAAPCGPSNCNGCCDLLGTCQGGGAAATCGSGGGLCTNCGTESCQMGVCTASTSGTGDGGVNPMCVGVGCNGTDDCVTWDPILLGLNCGFTQCVYGLPAKGSSFNLGACQ